MNNCEIGACFHPVMDSNSLREGGRLCTVHFFALVVVRHPEMRPPLAITIPEFEEFWTSIKTVANVQRAELAAWSKKYRAWAEIFQP